MNDTVANLDQALTAPSHSEWFCRECALPQNFDSFLYFKVSVGELEREGLDLGRAPVLLFILTSRRITVGVKLLSQIGTLAAATLLSVQPAIAVMSPKGGRLLTPLFFKASDCQERPEFLSELRTEVPGGFEALPKAVLVARDAEMWVEGPASGSGNDLRVHAYQSFMKAPTRSLGKILCGSSSAELMDRFSLHAPTLIDGSKDKKVGNSFWQFQVIADRQSYSVWNKKSSLFSQAEKIEKVMKDLKATYRLYQIGHNEYELLVQREDAGVIQTLSVRYEALK